MLEFLKKDVLEENAKLQSSIIALKNEIGRTPLVWSTCLTVIMEYLLVAPFFIWKRKGRACPGFFLRQPGHLIARPAAFRAFFAKGSAFREISGSFCIVHAANE